MILCAMISGFCDTEPLRNATSSMKKTGNFSSAAMSRMVRIISSGASWMNSIPLPLSGWIMTATESSPAAFMQRICQRMMSGLAES